MGDDLRNGGAELSASCPPAVAGASVPRRKALAWNDERGCVWAEIKEELGKNVERKEVGAVKGVVGKTDDAEYNGQEVLKAN